MTRFFRLTAFLAFVLVGTPSFSVAQSAPGSLLERLPGQPSSTRGAAIAATRHALVRVDPRALAGERIELTLFEDVRVTARRTSRNHPRAGSTVWHGRLEAPDDGEVTLAAVDGVIAGTMTVDGRLFEIGFAGGGMHEVREVNPALFPTEDLPVDAHDLVSSSGTGSLSVSPPSTSEATGQIDVMVVWTPAARNAAGGTTAAIQSVIDLAVANTNVSYAHSQVAASLRLVYSGEVGFTETPSAIATDLSRVTGTSDGYIDHVHSLRNQYGADVVTLMGSGYAKAGYCGVGYVMSSPSTAFATKAFNIVDQSCAGANLSYAHEVGHNQGLQHDPANAGTTPSYPFAYGYQDPSGAFRTLMSYGSAIRVQRLSNPSVLYSGKPTGTAMQDNSEALRRNTTIVASFRSSADSTTCSYTVTPTTMAFSETGGTASVNVTTAAGCAWATTAAASWVTVGTGGSDPGSVVVSVAANTGSPRSATITVAGVPVSISEAGVTTACSYTVTPTSSTVPSSGGTVQVQVTTAAGCGWTSRSHAGWMKVSGGGTGGGFATLKVGSTSGGARQATATIAGKTVTITQLAGQQGK